MKEFDRPRRRTPVTIGLLAALLVVVIGAVWISTSDRRDDAAQLPSDGPATSESTNPPVPQSDPAQMHSRTDRDWMTAAPAGLVWRQEDRVSLPFTAADGPFSVDEESGSATGYSRTPQGAVVAAYQIATRIALGSHFADVVDTQTVFDASAATDIKLHRGSPDPAALGDIHPSAFKVLAYLASQATVQYALPKPFDGTYNSYQFTVVWVDGDWKLVAPSDTASALTLSSIDGFTPF